MRKSSAENLTELLRKTLAKFYANKSLIFSIVKVQLGKVTRCIVNKSLFFLVIELIICEDHLVIFKHLSFGIFPFQPAGRRLLFVFAPRLFCLLSLRIKYSRLKKFPFFDAKARSLKIFTLEWRPRYKIHMTCIYVSCNSLKDLRDGNIISIIFARLFDKNKGFCHINIIIQVECVGTNL